jgi:hypothetical protein
MKIIITEEQYNNISEMIKLDIKVGDVIMGGKFKNKKVVVKTIGKNDKGDITINGKPLLRFRLLKESEHLKGLFSELPPFLKRRVTLFDLEWLDKELGGHIYQTPFTNDFNDFCDYVLGDLLHEFLVNRKDDEIETTYDYVYGIIYDDASLDKVATMYWKLEPFLKKRYEIRLRQAWERKRSL